MMIRLLIGVAIGVSIGALLGSTRSCADGGCPLTATPWRGAAWGGLLGLLLAFNVGPTQARSARTTDRQTGRGEPASVRTIATSEEFREQVLQRQGLALVTFHADWCGACATFAPTFDAAARQFASSVAFYKVDADRANQLTVELGVDSLPTTILLSDGKEKARLVGAVDAESLAAAVAEALGESGR